MGCGGERRPVGKTRLDSLHYIHTRSAAPQDRSPGPLGAVLGPLQTLSKVTLDRAGKGLTPFPRRGIARRRNLRGEPSVRSV